jgi:hypothetical protein
LARDLKQLQGALVAEGEPGLSPLDTRLNTITDLAEQRKFREAADQVESLLVEQVYDIRPLSIFLLQAFNEEGFAALSDVFLSLDALLGDNLAAVGPLKRREEQFNRRMIWLFDGVLDSARYHQQKKTADWERWSQPAAAEQIDAALASAGRVVSRVNSDAFRGAHTALSRLQEWLRGHAEVARVSGPPALTAAPAPASAAAPAGGVAVAPVQSAASPLPLLEPVRRRVELEVSHAFIELWVKLRAFESLIERGQFEKAALVGEDVAALLESFDPRAYFPELFGRFSALMSKHVGTLSAHSESRNNEHWKAMGQYYRVDLKGFIES